MAARSRHRASVIWLVCCLAFVLVGCKDEDDSGGGGDGGESCKLTATVPDFSSATFSNPTQVTNPYFPLVPGTVNVYRAVIDDEVETTVVEVTSTTRLVNGVLCVVVRDTVYVDELIAEDTLDWFAQDDAGNVWYFGEDSTEYEYDDNDQVVATDNSGSWEAGLDVAGTGSIAVAGIIMPAVLTIGDTYYQEYYVGEAQDLGRVEALNVSVTLSDGHQFMCLQTLECNPLEKDSHEFKYYAAGIGMVREEAIDEDEVVELRGTFITGAAGVPNFAAAVFSASTTIDNTFFPLTPGDAYTYRSDTDEGVEVIVVDVLNQTQLVAGVDCRVVRDRVYLDGRLIEDTFDWYAQDDAGNVWYMGEFVTNYQYNAMGTLVGTDNGGSWEAGVSGAEPGYIMPAAPGVGDSYHQEYWPTEAEDAAYVVATGVTVSLSNRSSFTGCLQTLDWNPLDPAVLEYKFYAPGLGMVMEVEVDGEEVVELTAKTP